MISYENQIRLRVLNNSLQLEAYASFWLRVFLDIDSTDSKTLGNSSNALSLNSKVNLLIDLAALDADKGDYFLKFMEIRNQFMHNLKADTFKNCFSFINGIASWFSKKFSRDETISIEDQYSIWYDSLSNLVLSEASMIFKKATDLLEERRLHEKNKASIAFLQKEIPQLLTRILDSDPSPDLADYLQTFVQKLKEDYSFLPERKTYKF